jgi:carotenoid cleavage dioxygenase
VRYASLADGVDTNAPSHLFRWIVDLTTGTVSEHQVDDQTVEFPRIDDRLAGFPAAYGYAAETPGPGSNRHGGAIHRYDLHNDLRDATITSHLFSPGRIPGEPAFIAADNRPGGPGWLVTFVYDATTDRSDLVILDAQDLTRPPTATVHLPRRVPYGFHGNWLPDA